MAHGSPDWWGQNPKKTTYTLNDLAELAARLGSVDVFDRQGDVVLYDDFGQGYCKWQQTVSHASGDILVNSREVRMSPYSIELYPGNVAGNTAALGCHVPLPALSGWSIETGFELSPNVWYYEYILTHYTGTTRYRYWVRYNHQLGTLWVEDNTLGFVQIGVTGVLDDTWHAFNAIKAVFDIESDLYERVLVNQLVYPCPQYAPVQAVSGLTPRLHVTIETVNFGGNASVYVDYVLVKQNEPIIEG